MATFVFNGYWGGDLQIAGGGNTLNVGSRFMLRSDWDADAHLRRFTVTDDDTVFDGDTWADEVGNDATQTGVVQDAAGNTLASGRIYLEGGVSFLAPDGAVIRLYVVEIAGSVVGLVSDAPLQPGVTYQVASSFDVSASGGTAPAYATLHSASYDPDLANGIQGGELADSLSGGAGNDTVSGGAGNDQVDLGDGDDVFGGWWGEDGNDTIHGGAGNDMIIAGAGDDAVFGGPGNDTISGASGSDTLHGGADRDAFLITDDHDHDQIDGGEDGDDWDAIWFANWASQEGVSVSFSGTGAGRYDFVGTEGHGDFVNIEEISGTDFADTIDARADMDGVALHGNGGDDLITGGKGDDILTGGEGDDILIGGEGDDFLDGGAGADTFVFADGSGADTVAGFDMTRVDGRTLEQLDVSQMTDADGGPLRSWDVTVSGDRDGNTLLTFPGGETVLLQGVSAAEVTEGHTLFSMGIPCFAEGTPILTPQGWRNVEDIAAGDPVSTRDRGAQPVLWRGARRLGAADLAARPEALPVRLRRGAFGNRADLLLSPQHAVLLTAPDGREVLVRARHLAEFAPDRARVARGRRRVTYHHLLLPQHALLDAAGLAAESLYPGPMALAAFAPAARAEIAAAVRAGRPGAGARDGAALTELYGPRVRPLLTRREAGPLVAALRAAGTRPGAARTAASQGRHGPSAPFAAPPQAPDQGPRPACHAS